MTTPIQHRPAAKNPAIRMDPQTTQSTQNTPATATAKETGSSPGAPHPQDFFDDTVTNPRALEVSDAGKPIPPGDADLSAQLATQRAAQNASGYGRGDPARLNANNVADAQRRARRVRNQRIDWNDRAAALNNLSQVDSDSTTNDDEARCGAAAISAGSILRGPDSTNAAVGRLRRRVDTLRAELDARGDPPDSGLRRRLDSAASRLDELGDRNAHIWRHRDAMDFQEAIYDVARTDTLMRLPTAPRGDGLPPETVRQYRDLTWGAARGADGRYQTMTPEYPLGDRNIPVDIQFRGDGHFVLAEGSTQAGRRNADGEYQPPTRDVSAGGNRIVFDSFPRSDGSAYSPAVDGGDERLQPTLSTTPGQRPGPLRPGDAAPPPQRFGFDIDQVPRLDRLSPEEMQTLVRRGD